MSFFLYFYAVKIQFTILFFIFSYNLLANTTDKVDNQLQDNITSTVAPSETTDAGILGGVSDDGSTLKGSLNSILSYSILIFFSVLIIILIDNRNLEKRYKRLVSDFKNKDPLV